MNRKRAVCNAVLFSFFLFRKLFIFENLLFYSALLYEFISRACRFNLYSAKDAYLLFRVIKVCNVSRFFSHTECNKV